MSPRPQLPPGAWGKITVSDKPEPRVGKIPAYKARARIRDRDGVVRPVVRYGQTKAAAESALRTALAERAATAPGISGDMRVNDLADKWLTEDIDESATLSVNTKQEYRYATARYVRKRIGNYRLREIDAGRADDVLKGIARDHGPSAARQARKVLNGMFGLAVRRGAMTANPVQGAAPVRVPRKVPRSLEDGRDVELSDKLRCNARAVAYDLPDLVDWMLATGCRIGEALAIRDAVSRDDGRPLLDLAGNTWEVDATSVRVKGVGTVIQERTKSQAGWRRITVPDFAMEMLKLRQATPRPLAPRRPQVMGADEQVREVEGLWVAFTSPQSRTLRDSSNTQGDLREVLDGLDCEKCAGTGYQLNDDGTFTLRATRKSTARVRCTEGPWSWITSHTFRKTVVTRLLKAGLDAGEVANHVGHRDPSMTLNVYRGRGVVSERAAALLAR